MQPTNYADYPVCINKQTALPEADGSDVIQLSHRPADRNGISTAGYNEGVIIIRWQLAEAMPETPTLELVKW